MPDSGEIDVAHVARLARLNLTAEETGVFQEQLRRVLEYAEKLEQATGVAAGVSPAEESETGVAAGVSPAEESETGVAAGVSPAEESEKGAGETPAATVNATSNALREDGPRPWFTAEEALSNAPRQANDLFVVPKVVE